MTRIAGRVLIAAAIAFFVAAVLELLAHSGIWAACWVLLGIALVLSAISRNPRCAHCRLTRRLSLGFAGGALVFLIFGSVQFFC